MLKFKLTYDNVVYYVEKYQYLKLKKSQKIIIILFTN